MLRGTLLGDALEPWPSPRCPHFCVAAPRLMGLRVASCTLSSLLTELCFIGRSRCLCSGTGQAGPGAVPFPGSAGSGGPGNAALPLVPSLTPWGCTAKGPRRLRGSLAAVL